VAYSMPELFSFILSWFDHKLLIHPLATSQYSGALGFLSPFHDEDD